MSSSNVFVVTAPNVTEMSDLEVNALIDLHAFKAGDTCTGRLEYHHVTGAAYYWQCVECGAIEHDVYVMQHQRSIPSYCKDMALAWRIVERIKALDDFAQMRFELALMAKYHCCLIKLTARAIAVSALEAMGIVDAQGLLIAKNGATQ
jgi:hypothetical protein